MATKKFKTFFTVNCALKRASDLKNDFKLIRFAFEVRQKFDAVAHGQKSFLSRQTHSRDIINILLTSFSQSVLSVTDPCFFPLRFMARTLRAWAINRRGKNSVGNLQYSPQTQLVRGIQLTLLTIVTITRPLYHCITFF